MRVWIDVSNSPQVPFFRPLIALLRERGHDVSLSTREYAQTTELLSLYGIEHDVVGPRHGGAGALGKTRAMAGRLHALRGYAGRREFDLALSHASHELPMVARSLGIPSSYAFDYEFARVQHGFGSRAARRVVVPEAIPQDRLDGLGASATKVRRYPGLKEEYYLHGFTPDAAVLDELGLDRERTIVVVRTPPDVSLYHREANPLFGDVLERLGRDPAVHAVVLPRTTDQRAEIVRASAALDPRARAGGRRAEPRGALRSRRVRRRHDEPRGGRSRSTCLHDVCREDSARSTGCSSVTRPASRARSADALEPKKRASGAEPTTRDPALLLDLMLSALES